MLPLFFVAGFFSSKTPKKGKNEGYLILRFHPKHPIYLLTYFSYLISSSFTTVLCIKNVLYNNFLI